MTEKTFVFQFIDGEKKAIKGDHYTITNSLNVYKEIALSSVVETSSKEHKLVAIVSLAQLKWFEIVEEINDHAKND